MNSKKSDHHLAPNKIPWACNWTPNSIAYFIISCPEDQIINITKKWPFKHNRDQDKNELEVGHSYQAFQWDIFKQHKDSDGNHKKFLEKKNLVFSIWITMLGTKSYCISSKSSMKEGSIDIALLWGFLTCRFSRTGTRWTSVHWTIWA